MIFGPHYHLEQLIQLHTIKVTFQAFKMVHVASTTVLGLILLTLGVSGAPSHPSGKVITLDDIKNAQPVVPEVTDPTKKALAGDPHDNSTFLQARPDLAETVNDAKKTVPSLLADDSPPKPAGKTARRDLAKRADVRYFPSTSDNACPS